MYQEITVKISTWSDGGKQRMKTYLFFSFSNVLCSVFLLINYYAIVQTYFISKRLPSCLLLINMMTLITWTTHNIFYIAFLPKSSVPSFCFRRLLLIAKVVILYNKLKENAISLKRWWQVALFLSFFPPSEVAKFTCVGKFSRCF
jgi:hypothetical protein